jgi:thymidylate synthase ThyX
MYAAKILADSITRSGHRLTTFEVTFPRMVLAEFNTHRVLSRNSASSRAIPVKTVIGRVEDEPFMPIYWGKNQKGMVAEEELSPEMIVRAQEQWIAGSEDAIWTARSLLDTGIHKQITNRVLEPYMWHTAIATATEWSNFFALRCDPNAQPEIQLIARMMKDLYDGQVPELKQEGVWHLPLMTVEDIEEEWLWEETSQDLVKPGVLVSAGRCARVSYLTHEGVRSTIEDIELANKLRSNGHMSPFEHAARPMTVEELEMFKQKRYLWSPMHKKFIHRQGDYTYFFGNVQGWVQARKLLPFEEDFGARPVCPV